MAAKHKHQEEWNPIETGLLAKVTFFEEDKVCIFRQADT